MHSKSISIREEGTLLYEIDRHFNPFEGNQRKNVFFLEGSKVDKEFYYNHHLPQADIPKMLESHFYDHFNIIGRLGHDRKTGTIRLRLVQGKEAFDELVRGHKPAKKRRKSPVRRESNSPLMKEREERLYQAWLDGRAKGIQLREEGSQYYEEQPYQAIIHFEEKVFQQNNYRAMLILEDYTTLINTVGSQDGPRGAGRDYTKVLQTFNRWCTDHEFRRQGHAVFFLAKRPLDTQVTAGYLFNIFVDIEGSTNVRRIEVHSHTADEFRSFFTARYLQHGKLPFSIEDLQPWAEAAAAYGRAHPDFGLAWLDDYLRSDKAWRRLSEEIGPIRPEREFDPEDFERYLHSQIFGQDEIISRVVSDVDLWIKVPDRDQPIASFLCVGPSGVGKTELARACARYFYGPNAEQEGKLLRIDLNTYTLEHQVSSLVGPPAGYSGFEQGGQLTRPIIEDGRRIVLFDEIEKGHPDALKVLFNVLEEGKLTEAGSGKMADFSHTIIIMTSNYHDRAFAELLSENANLDWHELTVQSRQLLLLPPPGEPYGQSKFTTPFLRRITSVLPYRLLSEEAMQQIARREIQAIAQKYGVQITDLDERVVKRLVDRNRELNTASDLIRDIQRSLEHSIRDNRHSIVQINLDDKQEPQIIPLRKAGVK